MDGVEQETYGLVDDSSQAEEQEIQRRSISKSNIKDLSQSIGGADLPQLGDEDLIGMNLSDNLLSNLSAKTPCESDNENSS